MKKYGKVRILLYLWRNSLGTDAGYFLQRAGNNASEAGVHSLLMGVARRGRRTRLKSLVDRSSHVYRITATIICSSVDQTLIMPLDQKYIVGRWNAYSTMSLHGSMARPLPTLKDADKRDTRSIYGQIQLIYYK